MSGQQRPLCDVDPADREGFDALAHGQDWFTKPVDLEENERLAKFEPSTYWLSRWRRSEGAVYLTANRLIFNPTALQWDRPKLSWPLSDISEIGTCDIPWHQAWFDWLRFHALSGWYVQVSDERHHFGTRRSATGRWLEALAQSTTGTIGRRGYFER